MNGYLRHSSCFACCVISGTRLSLSSVNNSNVDHRLGDNLVGGEGGGAVCGGDDVPGGDEGATTQGTGEVDGHHIGEVSCVGLIPCGNASVYVVGVVIGEVVDCGEREDGFCSGCCFH